MYLTGAGVLFAIGQIFNYVISTHLCQAADGKINGALFETLFTLLSVSGVWAFWSSITEDDWPLPVGGGGYNWSDSYAICIIYDFASSVSCVRILTSLIIFLPHITFFTLVYESGSWTGIVDVVIPHFLESCFTIHLPSLTFTVVIMPCLMTRSSPSMFYEFTWSSDLLV